MPARPRRWLCGRVIRVRLRASCPAVWARRRTAASRRTGRAGAAIFICSGPTGSAVPDRQRHRSPPGRAGPSAAGRDGACWERGAGAPGLCATPPRAGPAGARRRASAVLGGASGGRRPAGALRSRRAAGAAVPIGHLVPLPYRLRSYWSRREYGVVGRCCAAPRHWPLPAGQRRWTCALRLSTNYCCRIWRHLRPHRQRHDLGGGPHRHPRSQQHRLRGPCPLRGSRSECPHPLDA